MYIFEVKAVRYKCLRNMGKNTHIAIAKLQKKQQKTKGKIQKMTSNMRNLLLSPITCHHVELEGVEPSSKR